MSSILTHIILSARLLSVEGVALFLLAVTLVVLVWGASNVCSQLFLKVVCKGKTHQRHIALTFDDGPSKYTGKILAILEKHKVQATFFVIGKHAAQAPEWVKQIQNQGHTLGNHTYSHSYFFDFWSSRKMAADMAKANNMITKITGTTPQFFRPPYGVTNPPLALAVKKSNLTPIGWSLRSLDTIKTARKLQEKLLSKVGPGKIILLHDTMPTTANILDEFLTEMKKQNYKVVPLSELL
ncbi:MAG: polysaccharide deacetylase family protein [Bacteroidales bacterium]